MLLLKSLFCLTGADNRFRYIAIHFICYFLFAIASTVFAFSFFLSFLTLCLFTAISALSTKRRLKDANLNIKLLFPISCSFLISGLVILISNSSTVYWLLFLPLIFSTSLMTFKSKSHHHVLGYLGDIDLSGYIKQATHQQQTRIEPTFDQQQLAQPNSAVDKDSVNDYQHVERPPAYSTSQSQYDLGEMFRLKLLNNKPVRILSSLLLLLLTIALVKFILMPSINNNQNIEAAKEDNALETAQKQQWLHEVTLPDNFSLLTSSFNGINIKWQGDRLVAGFLWQQITAEGDETCKAIKYDDGKMIRTLNVIQDSNGDYLASFSPLDTNEIIKNIAKRNSFNLCGYEFSLKGSQAVLGKHSFYSNLISN